MAIVPERKNSLVLARDFRSKITARTGINDFDSDSKTEALVSVFVEQVLNSRNETIGAFNANHISTANGDQLDRIGQDMGVPRFAETFAFSQTREQSVAFYVSGTTFGGINGGADIVVPVNTVIFSDQNENDLNSRIEYVTTTQAILPAVSSISYVNVRAQASGTNSNVGAGVLTNHNFTNYSAGTGLQIVNFFSILNGRSRESDRNYRFRLSRHYDNLAGSNNTKLHLQALKVPGVIDTKIIPGYYGIGSVGVIVIGAEYQSNSDLIRAVQSRLNAISGPGSRMTATSATTCFFDIQMEVQPTYTLTAAEKRQYELVIRRALRNALRSAGLGATIVLQDIAIEIAQYTGGSIRLVSSGKPEGIFDTVYIRKGVASGTSTERDLLKSNYYTLEEDAFADLGTLSIRFV